AYTQKDGVTTRGDGCKAVDVSETGRMVIDGQVQESEGADITELTSSGVTYNDNDTDVWHVTGNIKGRVNNWNGTVTYAGATTNPTYTFTSTDGEVQDSTISPI